MGGPVGSVKFAGLGPWVASTEENDASFVTSRQVIFESYSATAADIFESYSATAGGNDV